jgi:hypothetical protein
MGEEDALELGGSDLEAFVFNEFFDAVRDVEVAVLVLVADVSGLWITYVSYAIGSSLKCIKAS